ncbi:hypothetical protein EV126DRAFT_414879 [Verticillium dahliae]|nr:hypothetical protein EV126DRAFT_435263 [Verticillium dahliae]KAH6704732.1 hypothetical protein EV126DRAFT_414879 [Verticillium dahliae]
MSRSSKSLVAHCCPSHPVFLLLVSVVVWLACWHQQKSGLRVDRDDNDPRFWCCLTPAACLDVLGGVVPGHTQRKCRLLWHILAQFKWSARLDMAGLVKRRLTRKSHHNNQAASCFAAFAAFACFAWPGPTSLHSTVSSMLTLS